MTPIQSIANRRNPDPVDLGPMTWGLVGKLGLAALLSWAGWEFRLMRDAVYSSQMRIAVVEERVQTLKEEMDKTNKRSEKLEARVFEGQSK